MINSSTSWQNDGIKPSDILDLNDMKISLPIDGEDSGSRADEIKENELSSTYESAYFHASSDGGVVFNVPPTTDDTAFTGNSNNPRTELREMLRAGDTSIPTHPNDDQSSNDNNWVFGNASPNPKYPTKNVNGELTATLAVNRVNEFSENKNDEGRVVIGQIHAGVIKEGGGEVPLLIIYRKLPNEDKGTIQLVSEDANGRDFNKYDLFLDSGNSSDGIELGERFSYNIKVEGDEATVTLSRNGKPDLIHTIDYSGKGYDAPDQFMYFKAGAYVLNNSVVEDDYTQVTFYQLDNTHDSLDDNSNSDDVSVSTQSIQSMQSMQSERLYSQETYRETLAGASGVSTRYDFDYVSNSTDDGRQDVIRNWETDLDIIDLQDIGITGLDTDGGQTEAGEIRLAYSSSSDRTYLRSDQSEFEAFIEGGDYRSLSNQSFVFAENTDNTI